MKSLLLALFFVSVSNAEVPNTPVVRMDYRSTESNRPVLGHDYPLIHHVKDFKLAQKQGRIFINPNLAELPAGQYLFILNENNDWIFGRDIDRYEIGVKHFVMAQQGGVRAAGEWTAGLFNLESGTYSREIEKLDPTYHSQMIAFIRPVFARMGDPNVAYTKDKIVHKASKETIKDLLEYCADKHFRKVHWDTICRDYVKPCEDYVSSAKE